MPLANPDLARRLATAHLPGAAVGRCWRCCWGCWPACCRATLPGCRRAPATTCPTRCWPPCRPTTFRWPPSRLFTWASGWALVTLLPRPPRLLRALWAYLLLHLLRCATLWLLPLEPPAGLVLLRDPLVDQLIYAAPAPITKDLFFSGHTATLLLLALAVPAGWRRRALLAGTVAVGTLVLVQHAHYTYDVLAAPLFVALAWWGSGWVGAG